MVWRRRRRPWMRRRWRSANITYNYLFISVLFRMGRRRHTHFYCVYRQKARARASADDSRVKRNVFILIASSPGGLPYASARFYVRFLPICPNSGSDVTTTMTRVKQRAANIRNGLAVRGLPAVAIRSFVLGFIHIRYRWPENGSPKKDCGRQQTLYMCVCVCVWEGDRNKDVNNGWARSARRRTRVI